MAKQKQEKTNDCSLNDEIDLSPYINRVLARKWIISSIVVICALAGYFLSALLPVTYEARGLLGFKGHKTIGSSTGQLATSAIVSPVSLTNLINKLNDEGIDGTDELRSISVTGIEYPLEIIITTTEKTDISKVSAEIVSTLNTNEYIMTALEDQRLFISENITRVEDTLSEVETQVQGAKQATFSCTQNSALLGSAYSSLISLKKALELEKLSLEKELSELQGFLYVAEPYYSNNGEPVSPNKPRNAMIAALVAGAISVTASAFIKTRKEK